MKLLLKHNTLRSLNLLSRILEIHYSYYVIRFRLNWVTENEIDGSHSVSSIIVLKQKDKFISTIIKFFENVNKAEPWISAVLVER